MPSTIKQLIVLLFFFLVPIQICAAENNAANFSEYELKAVCLYNFTHFAYWPTAKESQETESVTIGIVGRSPFGRAFEDLQAHLQKAGRKNFTILYYGPYQGGMNLRKSHLLYISSSEKKSINSIIASIGSAPVLTVSDMDGFLKVGGMINLVVRNNKVRWAVNRTALNSAGLHLNAKLLQLAVRVEEISNKPKSHHHLPIDDAQWPIPPKALTATPFRHPQLRWTS